PEGWGEAALAETPPASPELWVRDPGIGVPLGKRTQIFERFVQATDNTFPSGLGLGLYVSRHIIELHGGTLRADFPADGGTRMVVELPLSQPSLHVSITAD